MTATKTRKSTRTAKTPEQRKAEIEALEARQTEALLDLTTSESWQRYIAAGRLFRSYSAMNTLLILVQCPQATQVAGFNTWKKVDRSVVKGSKSLKIWGAPYRPTIWVAESAARPDQPVLERKDGQVKVHAGYSRYPILSVFDVSQTEGQPLPSVCDTLTDGDPSEVAKAGAVIVLVSGWLATTGWNVTSEATRPGLNGFTDFDGHRVVLADGLSVVQQAKTLLHETAHVVLHGDNTWADMDNYHAAEHRGVAEVQAESVAWAVANMVGLDTANYSTGYVANWAARAAKSEDAKDIVAAVQQTAQAVRVGINAIMDVIEGPAPVEATA